MLVICISGSANGNHLWKKTNLNMFPLIVEVDPQGDMTSSGLILDQLMTLKNNSSQYFSSNTVEKYDWMHNPYTMPTEFTTTLSIKNFRRAQHFNRNIKFWLLVKKRAQP